MHRTGLKKTIFISIGMLLCLATGWVSSRFQADALIQWYPLLNKSPLTPPNQIFPVAWTILYICMGTSIGLLWASRKPDHWLPIGIFAAQLLLNFSWSIVFFRFQNPFGALLVIVILLILIVLYAVMTYRQNRLSSILFYPYILWTSFALYLNAYIVWYN